MLATFQCPRWPQPPSCHHVRGRGDRRACLVNTHPARLLSPTNVGRAHGGASSNPSHCTSCLGAPSHEARVLPPPGAARCSPEPRAHTRRPCGCDPVVWERTSDHARGPSSPRPQNSVPASPTDQRGQELITVREAIWPRGILTLLLSSDPTGPIRPQLTLCPSGS